MHEKLNMDDSDDGINEYRFSKLTYAFINTYAIHSNPVE